VPVPDVIGEPAGTKHSINSTGSSGVE
jgi:hypothetical protein